MHSPLGRGALLRLALSCRLMLRGRLHHYINRALEPLPGVGVNLDVEFVWFPRGRHHATSIHGRNLTWRRTNCQKCQQMNSNWSASDLKYGRLSPTLGKHGCSSKIHSPCYLNTLSDHGCTPLDLRSITCRTTQRRE